MRHRLEDLGRVAAYLDKLLNHKVFDEHMLPRRPKDFWEWFASLSDDRKEDVLRNWAYGLSDLKDEICDILSIAEGTDRLNEDSLMC